MDLAESSVLGGMLIVHKLHEGKNEYKVADVVKCRNANGEKTFASKGDTLVRINDVDMQNLTPEEVTHLMAESNPKLTMHKSSQKEEPSTQAIEEADFFYPVSKQSSLLTFKMEMTQDDEWEEDQGVRQEGSSGEGSQETSCTRESGGGQSLFIVSMQKTRISVLKARCGEGACACLGCVQENCCVNDVIMMAESSTVTLVSRGSESFSWEKSSEMALKSVPSQYYLHGLCSGDHNAIFASPNPERITMYYYKSKESGDFRGMPVVLNFTGSNCYLRCCEVERKVTLQIGTSTKGSLRKISKSDPATLSFLFYMKADRTRQHKFESALHHGWFIEVLDTKLVDVAQLSPETEETPFLFIIQSD